MTTKHKGVDPREVPIYPVALAAFCLHGIPQSTLRAWVFGQENFVPLIKPHDKAGRLLSFVNLVEAHVLAAMRRTIGLNMPKVRLAIGNVSRELGIERPLANAKFKTDGVDLFVERLGEIKLASGDFRQSLLADIGAFLKRVEWDAHDQARRLFPFPRHIDLSGIREGDPPRLISIDPRVQFGQPVLVGTRIPTAIIAERFFANEPMASIAEDYGVDLDLVETAIRWEQPRQKAA